MAKGKHACMNWLASASAAVGVGRSDLEQAKTHAPDGFSGRVRALADTAQGIQDDIAQLRRDINRVKEAP